MQALNENGYARLRERCYVGDRLTGFEVGLLLHHKLETRARIVVLSHLDEEQANVLHDLRSAANNTESRNLLF